jgi:hypothetical protein
MVWASFNSINTGETESLANYNQWGWAALGRKKLSAAPSSTLTKGNMADYFTNFSLVISLASETEQQYALDLAHKASFAQQGDELPADFPKELVDMIEDWHFETMADDSGTKHGLWLHSSYGGVDAVCAFIQHLLQKFDPKAHVTFEWSHDCSKPRVDAYGGGAAFITAQEIKTMSTADWLSKQIA